MSGRAGLVPPSTLHFQSRHLFGAAALGLDTCPMVGFDVQARDTERGLGARRGIAVHPPGPGFSTERKNLAMYESV